MGINVVLNTYVRLGKVTFNDIDGQFIFVFGLFLYFYECNKNEMVKNILYKYIKNKFKRKPSKLNWNKISYKF